MPMSLMLMKIIIMQSLSLFLGLALSALLVAGKFCKPYCSTTCSPGYQDCAACQAPFLLNTMPAVGCFLNSTLQMEFASELSSSSSFAFSGYSSNAAPSTQLCTDAASNPYYMLGFFVANNYLFKAFTGLGTNHFQVDVFWSYGIFDTWSGQQLSTIFTDSDGTTTIYPVQGQTCPSTQTMTGCSSNTGCFLNYQQTLVHSSDYLSVNFSSMGSSILSPRQWAVKDLVIVLSICNPACLTCSGSASTDCLSCPSGFYLLGSTCILSCPYKAMPITRTCVTACPSYFYSNSYNGFCEPCPSGCPSCSNSTNCMDWGSTSTTNTLLDYLPLWIVIAVTVVALVALLVWKYWCSSKSFESKMEEEVIDHRSREQLRETKKEVNQSNETMEARWLQDIDDLNLTALGGKKAKVGIQGIGRELSNI